MFLGPEVKIYCLNQTKGLSQKHGWSLFQKLKEKGKEGFDSKKH
jgi:hypothetical protein